MQNKFAEGVLANSRFHGKSDSTDWFTASPEYTTFLNSDSATLLWYPGPPKSGKSVLLGRLHLERAEHRKEFPDVYGGYFSELPSTGKARILNTIFPHNIFRVLLSQVLIQSTKMQDSSDTDDLVNRRVLPPSVKHLISQRGSDWEDFFCNQKDFLPESSNEAMKNLLQTTLEAIQPKSALFTIDNVDQMTVRARETFLYLLLQMWKALEARNVRVHILVTSRPYSDIGALFENVPTILQYREYKG
jgi:hypothetical protein